MNSPIVIAIGAGLVSGALFASAASGSALAFTLFYLAPLPLLVAGLGWSAAAAGIAALAGAAAAVLVMGLAAAPLYIAGIGGPAIVLSYLALLSRQGDRATESEWYPPGRLLAWIVLMGAVLAAVAVPFVGTSVESYTTTIKGFLDNRVAERLGEDGPMDADTVRAMGDVLAQALPAAFATLWSIVMIFNLWAAGRILLASGRLSRPWPDFATLELPPTLTAAFAAAVLLSFLPNLIGVIATGFAGAIFLAYVMLGLAVIHVATQGAPLRIAILAALYIGIFLFGWIALIIGVIGLGEPALKLRERAISRAGGPPSAHPD